MKRILVIEDDAGVRELIAETLQLKGWQPALAADGEEGARMAQSSVPDLIVCDIQMPKMDGYEVLRKIRKDPTTAAVPFIFLTGLTDKPFMRQAMEEGADDYLVKPFTVQELLAAVDARFQKQAVVEKSADRRLNELRESLTFALPHELVTPLNAILGFSSLILDSPEVRREELTEYASHIRSSAQRLRKLVEKFLLYAQVELTAADAHQKRSLSQRTPMPTDETIVAAAMRVARENHREGDLEQRLGRVDHRMSHAHLERLVRELVENAFKFSEPGGRIEVNSSRENGNFKIEVTDYGRGFTPEQIKKIDANMQFDRKLQEQQGTGLGLAIARRLAELYGGSLEIESKPGERTTVRVQVPA
ncbi:MAG TPA: response regulator [Verrucomicrobiae bacterium]|jgi:signal transduction histidine kinase|nr:response regulator [Verrucomicrobiae bacterium]